MREREVRTQPAINTGPEVFTSLIIEKSVLVRISFFKAQFTAVSVELQGPSHGCIHLQIGNNLMFFDLFLNIWIWNSYSQSFYRLIFFTDQLALLWLSYFFTTFIRFWESYGLDWDLEFADFLRDLLRYWKIFNLNSSI